MSRRSRELVIKVSSFSISSLSLPDYRLQRAHSRVTCRADTAHGPRHAARRRTVALDAAGTCEDGRYKMVGDESARRFGVAWLGLCLAFAIHVVDEAATGFLAVYNPTVEAIRASVPWLPVPTFTCRVWLRLLIVADLVLLGLSVFAFRGVAWLRPLAYVFGVVMLLNGALHTIGTLYMRQAMPGVYSSPLLFAGSIWLLVATRRASKAEVP